RPAGLQGPGIGVAAVAQEEEIGIEAAVELDDAHLEAFLEQQGDGTLGGAGAGGVGIEVDGRLLAEAAEGAELGGGEGGAAGGDDVGEAGGGDADAIEVALDQDGVAEVADGVAGLIEVVEHAAFGVERMLGELRYLGVRASAASARPPKAMGRPRSSWMGKIRRWRKRS